MITLTFEQFMKGDYDNRGEFHELYVLKGEGCVLYVGISTVGIWQRWFDYPNSHIALYGSKGMNYRSAAGEAVVKCLPESLNWSIELWTQQDCLKFLDNQDLHDLRSIEGWMIDRLRPALNTEGRRYRIAEEDLPEIVRKYRQSDIEKALSAYHQKFSRD